MLATVESARVRPRSLTQRLTAHPGDVAERGVAEAGQDVDVEVGAVALVGGEADVVGVEPFVDPAGEGDLAVFGVDEHVAVLVGFDGVRAGGGGFGGGGCYPCRRCRRGCGIGRATCRHVFSTQAMLLPFDADGVAGPCRWWPDHHGRSPCQGSSRLHDPDGRRVSVCAVGMWCWPSRRR